MEVAEPFFEQVGPVSDRSTVASEAEPVVAFSENVEFGGDPEFEECRVELHGALRGCLGIVSGVGDEYGGHYTGRVWHEARGWVDEAEIIGAR